MVVYLNDGLGVGRGDQRACVGSSLVQDTLKRARFMPHPEKSIWKPVQHLKWPGFVIDTALGQIEVPKPKLDALRSMIERVKASPVIMARHLASILGKIISMSIAFGLVSRFMTRSLYAVLESRQSWWDPLQLSIEAQAELMFWSYNLEKYNAQPIWHSPSAVRVVSSDASDTGYGGYVVEHGGCISYR